MLDEAECEAAYLAIADMIDMRMPNTFGHSRAVAALAEAAGKPILH
jgi:HD-GYP domain-containing protein (c-di-GMP phosphodiesterase class II)